MSLGFLREINEILRERHEKDMLEEMDHLNVKVKQLQGRQCEHQRTEK